MSEVQKERHDQDDLVLQRDAEIKRLRAEIERLEHQQAGAPADTASVPEAAS